MCKELKKKIKEDKKCDLCGVPHLLHSKTCCGWDNASILITHGQLIPANFSGEEKRKAYENFISE